MTRVTLAHGGGGRMTQRLIRGLFQAEFDDPALAQAHDGAFAEGLAFTTDSFVVNPLFFPGGDIGSLAVNGTVNDLAMCAAQPLLLTCAVIIEEGLPLETLRRVTRSMGEAARLAGARIVTGDTKVVERGKGDGLYLNTAGIGRPLTLRPPLPREARPGDVVLLSGDVGAHAAAILSVREGLGFETSLQSDCAPLWPQVRALIGAGVDLHCLRDLTRGGLATALNELAEASGLCVAVDERAIPVRPEVAGAAELFGLDPLYMACEGRFIAFVHPSQRDQALSVMAACAPLQAPACIGVVLPGPAGEVRLRTGLGVERMLDMLSGEQLPRIC